LDNRELLVTSITGKVIEPGSSRFLMNEGMPRQRDPTEKGHLFIEFEVIFPENNFISPEDLLKLEKFLPQRPEVMDMPDAGETTECHLVDMEKTEEMKEEHRTYGDAYNESDDDDDGPHAHGPGVQCATQ